MTHQPERYKSAEKINISEIVAVIRSKIGELEDLRSPTETEVLDAIEKYYPHLLENEKRQIVEAFLQSEEDAAAQADAAA